tara:strand:+ start:13 stop:573 length:561 start_codon:yes stop_codon:yes gene_type:complete
MKKVVLVLVMVALTFGMNAQVSYGEYSQGKVSMVVEKGKNQGMIYLDLNSKGTYGLILKNGEGEGFIEFLQSNFNKFTEWAVVAEEKRVTELTKKTGSIRQAGFFKYGGWKFGTSNLSISMNIQDGKIRAYLYGSKIQSSSNQYIKSDSVLFFIDQEIIDELKSILSPDKINEFLTSRNNADKLFN